MILKILHSVINLVAVALKLRMSVPASITSLVKRSKEGMGRGQFLILNQNLQPENVNYQKYHKHLSLANKFSF